MEQATQAISALHPALRGGGHVRRRLVGPALPEPLVRSILVIVLDELVQHPSQMLPAEDQEVIEHLAACCPHPSLRE